MAKIIKCRDKGGSMEDLIMEYLNNSPTKRIKTRKIEDYLLERLGHRKYDYQQFVAVINDLIAANKIGPVKARGKNARKPRLYNWYQLKSDSAEISKQLKQELLTAYSPQLSLSYYFNNLEQYQQDKEHIKSIDQFFRSESKTEEMTVNERSFQLFGAEKFLTSNAGSNLLARLGIDVTDLKCHLAAEPFFYYQKQTNSSEENILIIENKDTFFSLKELLQAGINRWSGIEISLLIYGEGKKIQHSFSFFKELDEYQADDLDLNFYYFGDLDPEGIQIWWGLENNYEVEFEPLEYFYQQLISNYQQRAPKLRTAQNFNHQALTEFCNYFDKSVAEKIESLLAAEKYIPQEGLNYQLLKELSGREEEL
ncbi:MAG: Wadjet anti-phage system protein JetD domain-containing protein [Bacillota bacterium]